MKYTHSVNEPMELLVDNHAGVYSYHTLAQQYPLYVTDEVITGYRYIDLATYLDRRADMEGETIQTVFHPENEEWCENVEYLQSHNILAVQADNGDYWTVDAIDGDLWAINPNAVWDDSAETYIMEK